MRLVKAIVALAAAELVVSYFFLNTTLEENCDNGVARWQCNGVIGDVSAVFFWALFVVLVVLVTVGLWRIVSGLWRRIVLEQADPASQLPRPVQLSERPVSDFKMVLLALAVLVAVVVLYTKFS